MNEADDAVQRMWRAFTDATGVEAELTDAFAFGDSPELADELAALVRHGPKRATAALLLDYETDGERPPEPGAYSVVLDGRGAPLCIIRTTAVEIRPFDQVDAAHAWDEGEDDRSLDSWREAHRRFFTRMCQRLGVPFTEDLPVVLERFALVWPE